MIHKHKSAARTADILSNMPRHLIDLIVACIPARDAAKTCILSRKWRYIWATHPHLVFDKKFIEETFTGKRSSKLHFVKLISKILLLHSGPILKFCIYIPYLGSAEIGADVDQWILFLSRNGIQRLLIDNLNDMPFRLSSYIYSCPELTHFTLCNCIIKPPSSFPCFSKLILLLFNKISLSSNILETLVSSAPLLEKLFLIQCCGIDHFNINAPKLKSFHIYDASEFKSLTFKNTPSVDLVFVVPCHYINSSEHAKDSSMIELLHSLPSIVTMTVDAYFLKALDAATAPRRHPTTITSLKSLTLFNIDFNDLDQIPCVVCLLRSSPNLHELEIRGFALLKPVEDPAFNFLDEPDCTELKLDQLQILKIFIYRAYNAELLFVKFLLAHCPSVDKLFVEINGLVDEENEKFRISEELMRFPRASIRAEIIYVEPHGEKTVVIHA